MRRHWYIPLLAVVMALLYGPRAYAAIRDGNELLRDCSVAVAISDRTTDLGSTDAEQEKNTIASVSCLLFLQGVTQASVVYQFAVKKDRPLVCLPAGGITNGQAARIVVKHLKEHPETLHVEAAVLSIQALAKAFPCSGRP